MAEVGRSSRIALASGIGAIVVGLALVLATVHPAIPLIAAGVILVAVGVGTWRKRGRRPTDRR